VFDFSYHMPSAQASSGTYGNYGPESYTYDSTTGNLEKSGASVTHPTDLILMIGV